MQKFLLATIFLLLFIVPSVHANPLVVPLVEAGFNVLSNCNRVTFGHCFEVVGAALSIKDFSAKPVKKDITAVNCQESEAVEVEVHSELWLSDQDILVNGSKIDTIKAQLLGKTQTVSFNLAPAAPTGEEKRKEKVYVAMTGVGTGFLDSDKINYQAVPLDVTHLASEEEMQLWKQAKSLTNEYNDVANKISFLGTKGTTVENNAKESLEKAVEQIKNCQFTAAFSDLEKGTTEIRKMKEQWSTVKFSTKAEYYLIAYWWQIILVVSIVVGILAFLIFKDEGPGVF